MSNDLLAPSTAPVVKRRFHWMDMLRGLAILLVLVWHAAAVLVLKGAQMPPAIMAANMFFLPYRMPTLMFLSGLLLPASMRKSLLVYYVGKFSMIVWPYVLWVSLDRVINHAQNPWFHWRSWYATSYLWFLFFIGVYYVIAPALKRLPSWVPVAGFAVVSLVLPHGVEERLAYFAVFFFAGRMFALHPGWLERCTRGWIIRVFAVVALAYGVYSAVLGLAVAYRIEYGPASFAGICTAIWITRTIDERGRALPRLTFVGRNSIVFYVSHFPIMVGLTAGLTALGFHSFVGGMLVNLVVALTVCMLLARFRSRPPIVWLYGAPAVLGRWAARISARPKPAVAAPGPVGVTPLSSTPETTR